MDAPIVILASSRKFGGVCLAGKRLGGRSATWIRPVSRAPQGAWTAGLLRCVAGAVPGVGSCMEIPLAHPDPDGHQSENWQVRYGRWTSLGALSALRLASLADPEQPLWLDGEHSIHGWNDRCPEALVQRDCHDSLRFIRPASVRFQLDVQGQRIGVRAAFNWGGQHYLLCVTDPQASARWQNKLANGHDGQADAYLSLSLGLPFMGYCYKLVAGVIEVDTGA